MAPEVYAGAEYGFNVDSYSLGIVLYRLLNRNRTPFLPEPPAPITLKDREAALARRMSGEQIPPPYYAQGRLAEIVMKACAFDPRSRYNSPMQMRQELEAILYDYSDSQLIYPEGDKLSISPNEYVSSTDAATGNETIIDAGGSETLGSASSVKPPKKKKWVPIVAALLAISIAAGGFLIRQQRLEKRKQQFTANMEEALQYRDFDPVRALQLYAEAQELYPEEEVPYVSYAYTLYGAGNYDDCITYIENDLALGKKFSLNAQSQLSEILGAAYFEKQDYAAAASFFRLSAAGGEITVPAMRDYAVSLGRLGDVQAANEVVTQMIKAGAVGDVNTYVQAEIDYALKNYIIAEEGFRSTLETTADKALQRRSLRSLAELYRDCTSLAKTGESPIDSPAIKEAQLLSTAITDFNLQYDSTLMEMLAMAWFEAYRETDNSNTEYLQNAAKCFNDVIGMGIEKDYLYRNLYTIFYELKDYIKAEEALKAYETKYPGDYMPHALRSILLIAQEEEKPISARNYSAVVEEYNIAGKMIRSSDDRGYYLQIEGLIKQLDENGWL